MDTSNLNLGDLGDTERQPEGVVGYSGIYSVLRVREYRLLQHLVHTLLLCAYLVCMLARISRSDKVTCIWAEIGERHSDACGYSNLDVSVGFTTRNCKV